MIDQKTYRLTIYREDGSVYWIENANDLSALERWLDEEKTRPYWEPTYTTAIEEI